MPFKRHLPALILLLILASFCCANAQTEGQSPPVVLLNQQVQVAALPSIVADSKTESDVMTASVALAVMDAEICCGRRSALEDQTGSSRSLKELGEKLRGKRYLNSGSSIVIADQYWLGASVNADIIVNTLMAQRPLIMHWNGHFYVAYGAVFDEYRYADGPDEHVIHKLLLIDPRFSDHRRYAVFNRETDDWGRVSGLLALVITR